MLYRFDFFTFVALNGKPSIKDNKGQLIPNNTVYHINPGKNLYFNCEGITGKPKIPIIWTESNGTTERVLKGEDGVTPGTCSKLTFHITCADLGLGQGLFRLP